jgi:hypothetical protein
MYAKLIRKRETSFFRLYGRVIDSRGERVIPIVDDNTYMYVQPINELRMKNILDYAWNRLSVKGTQHVLRDYMAMYEERRILGTQGTLEPGPRMLEAICMKITIKLDAHGGTVGEPKVEELTAASAFPPVQSPAISSNAATRPATLSEASP